MKYQDKYILRVSNYFFYIYYYYIYILNSKSTLSASIKDLLLHTYASVLRIRGMEIFVSTDREIFLGYIQRNLWEVPGYFLETFWKTLKEFPFAC